MHQKFLSGCPSVTLCGIIRFKRNISANQRDRMLNHKKKIDRESSIHKKIPHPPYIPFIYLYEAS